MGVLTARVPVRATSPTPRPSLAFASPPATFRQPVPHSTPHGAHRTPMQIASPVLTARSLMPMPHRPGWYPRSSAHSSDAPLQAQRTTRCSTPSSAPVVMASHDSARKRVPSVTRLQPPSPLLQPRYDRLPAPRGPRPFTLAKQSVATAVIEPGFVAKSARLPPGRLVIAECQPQACQANLSSAREPVTSAAATATLRLSV